MVEGTNILTLCSKADVDEGSVVRVQKDELDLAVYCVESIYYVTDNLCTHGPGYMVEGYLDGHVIECDFHSGAFDIRTGEVVAPPCMVPLKTYPVIDDATDIKIDIS
jgi:nitrite reductase/ring-hydroxylating ferredoxin subunit